MRVSAGLLWVLVRTLLAPSEELNSSGNSRTLDSSIQTRLLYDLVIQPLLMLQLKHKYEQSHVHLQRFC